MLSSLAKYDKFAKLKHVDSKKQLFVRGIYWASPEAPPTSSPLREGREAGTEAGREAERESGGEAGVESGREADGSRLCKIELCKTELCKTELCKTELCKTERRKGEEEGALRSIGTSRESRILRGFERTSNH